MFRTGVGTRRKTRSLEVLVVAGLFFFPGVAMLFQQGTVVAFQKSFRYLSSDVMVLFRACTHLFGALAIAVSLVIVCFYFYLRGANRPR